jgi:hypothetical protein
LKLDLKQASLINGMGGMGFSGGFEAGFSRSDSPTAGK